MIASAGTLIIAFMLYQHWSIHKRSGHHDWDRTLKFYRTNMQVAVVATILFIFASMIVMTIDFWKDGMIGLLSEVYKFTAKSQGPLSVMCIAFFGGVLRLSAERAVGASAKFADSLTELRRSFFDRGRLSTESSIGKISGGALGQRQDAWFAWLCVSLVVALANTAPNLPDLFSQENVCRSTISEQSPSSLQAPAGEHPSTNAEAITSDHVSPNEHASPKPACKTSFEWLLMGIVTTMYVAIGYFLWIYMVLFSKLTQEHHFTSRAARLFLGGLLTDQIPRQCVLVGPPHAGKTFFSRPLGIRRDERPTQDQRTGPTGRIDIRTGAIQRTNGEGGPTTIQLTTLDTPGENMGDHILLTSIFRSDVLVFVLDIEMLDIEKMENATYYSLGEWHNLIAKSNEEAIRQTKIYMQGFHLATNRTKRNALIESDELYKVQSFVLYLNRKPAEIYLRLKEVKRSAEEIESRLKAIQESIDANKERWQALARGIGERFGVAEEHCCCIGGKGSADDGSNLLALSTNERTDKAVWPGSTHW